MHEQSIVRQLLRQVEMLRDQHDAHTVLSVRVSIGQFSGVEPELLQSAFDELSPESCIPDAELVIDMVPLEAECKRCRQEFFVKKFRFVCPTCDSRDIEIIRGEDLMLESVALEGEKIA